jgi:hypothetical protein
MHKALRNTTGNPVTPENLDKRDKARHAASLKPTGDLRQVDRDYEPNRVDQADVEQKPYPAKGK